MRTSPAHGPAPRPAHHPPRGRSRPPLTSTSGATRTMSRWGWGSRTSHHASTAARPATTRAPCRWGTTGRDGPSAPGPRIVGVEASTRRSQWRRAQSERRDVPACSRSKQPLVNPIRSPARRHPSTTGASRRDALRPWPRGRTAAAARPPRPATARGGRSARCGSCGHRQAGREVSPGDRVARRQATGDGGGQGGDGRVRRLPTRRTPSRALAARWLGRSRRRGSCPPRRGSRHVVEAQVVCAALGAVDHAPPHPGR